MRFIRTAPDIGAPVSASPPPTHSSLPVPDKNLELIEPTSPTLSDTREERTRLASCMTQPMMVNCLHQAGCRVTHGAPKKYCLPLMVQRVPSEAIRAALHRELKELLKAFNSPGNMSGVLINTMKKLGKELGVEVPLKRPEGCNKVGVRVHGRFMKKARRESEDEEEESSSSSSEEEDEEDVPDIRASARPPVVAVRSSPPAIRSAPPAPARAETSAVMFECGDYVTCRDTQNEIKFGIVVALPKKNHGLVLVRFVRDVVFQPLPGSSSLHKYVPQWDSIGEEEQYIPSILRKMEPGAIFTVRM